MVQHGKASCSHCSPKGEACTKEYTQVEFSPGGRGLPAALGMQRLGRLAGITRRIGHEHFARWPGTIRHIGNAHFARWAETTVVLAMHSSAVGQVLSVVFARLSRQGLPVVLAMQVTSSYVCRKYPSYWACTCRQAVRSYFDSSLVFY